MTKETAHHHTTVETPIVVETKKHKKKFSNTAARTLQEFEDGMTKSAQKISKAVQQGLDAYEAARKESAASKKDGAFRDYLHNQSKALRKALPLAAEAPSDLLDAIADMKVVREIFDKHNDED